MATRTRRAASPPLYEEDFYTWTQRQGALLRERRFAELDLVNLIEEVEDLGSNRRDAVVSHARQLIWHLLKLQFSPAAPPRRGWRQTVCNQRLDLEQKLTPSLRQHLAATLADIYDRARGSATIDLEEDRVPAESLPPDCPYPLDQLLDSNWLPDNGHGLRDEPRVS